VAQERFDSITVGGWHACALNKARFAYCWGKDSLGQLGDNRLVNSTTPIPVIGGREFSSISAGDDHTCGISNGQAFCWGNNDQGQLGNGTIGGHSAVPVAVSGGQSFGAISAGGKHTCALTTLGLVMCWGANNNRQVKGGGVGSASVTVPTSVGSGTFSMVSAGRNHTCALASSGGTVSCWGWNFWAQSGNSDVNNPAVIGVVGGGQAFRSVSAGAEHSCGIATDGETYCWGSNVLGALGNELQAAYRATPQKVAVPR
jgi:alpha-tubulin suppressor-like RCC1 family protein